MRIKVNFPGYWAHGKVYEAEQEFLDVKQGQRSIQHARWRKRWEGNMETTAAPDCDALHCWVIRDDQGQPWAIPYSAAVEVAAEAA